MVDWIQQKKMNLPLTATQLDTMMKGYCKGDIPDYQMAAFLMAVYFNGLSEEETVQLTLAMVRSGHQMDLSRIHGIKVDKHSSGGVGDKTSLIVGPIAASLGVPVAKMSGRGLGHTGGTIDKLESIPGFHVHLSDEQFIEAVNSHKLALTSQTELLSPADKKLYALRDVTATVDSMPLIASSIMSKKIAAGADAIVLDVKVGSGAFMKTLDEARKLAETMVRIGKGVNKQTVAILSNMNQPLGQEIGNANEIKEVIQILKGKGPDDLIELSSEIAAHMVLLGEKAKTLEEARQHVRQALQSGRALDAFRSFIVFQGGDARIIDEPERLPQATQHVKVRAKQAGIVTSLDAEKLGNAAMLLGAGRAAKEDSIDHAAGITLVAKVGDSVAADDVLCILHTNKESWVEAVRIIEEACQLGDGPAGNEPMIYDIVK